ncbi:MAG: zinc ribbon domain-containing protein [Desulfomonile sp.]|nr:zinc ribbon domain-containing protein [Desulfomonile sp.]
MASVAVRLAPDPADQKRKLDGTTMKDAPHVDIRALRSDIIAGLDARSLTKKYRMSDELLGKLVSRLVERGDLTHDDLNRLYSVSELIRALTWKCAYCRKVVPAAYEYCTRCGNPRR